MATTQTTNGFLIKEVQLDSDAGRKTEYVHFLNDGNSVTVDDVTDQIHKIIVFVIIPAISIMGVVGNVLSIIVIWKHGLKRSSDILLFSLAISDLTLLIGFNAPPKVIYEWGDGGFQYSKQAAYVWYNLYQIFDSLNWIGGSVSFLLPVVITVERIFAVFYPLKFHIIVTRVRITAVILGIYVFIVVLQIYMRTWYRFDYIFDANRNASIGVAARSDLYWNQREASFILGRWHNSMSVTGIVVACGCLAIGIKVKHAATKRQKMVLSQGKNLTGKEGRMSRTTKTLMVVCIFYTVSCLFAVFPAVMPNLMVFPLFTDEPNFRSVGVFVYHLMKVDLCLNASCNFVIYVVMNQKFRETLIIMFRHHGTAVSDKRPSQQKAVRGPGEPSTQ